MGYIQNSQFCHIDGFVLFLGQCLSKDGLNFLFLILAAYVIYKAFNIFFNKRKDVEQEFVSREYSYASFKPLEKGDFKQIAVHELGHALVAMIYPSIFKDLFLQIFDKEIETVYRGYIFYQLNSEIKDTNLLILEIKMLILLGGMQAEKQYFEGNCLVNGCKSDLEQWLKIAQIYQMHNDDIIFYSNPANEFEHQHNAQLLSALKKKQIAILSEFFNANGALLANLVDSTMQKKRLSFNDLKEISTNMVITNKMPQI